MKTGCGNFFFYFDNDIYEYDKKILKQYVGYSFLLVVNTLIFVKVP